MLDLTVSVVIPAHNEAEHLGPTLASFRGQTVEPDEIIVVCDACDDETVTVAQAHGCRALVVAHRHPSLARDAGAGAASGDVLLIQDADTLVAPNYVERVLEAIRDGAAYGGARLVSDGRHPLGLLRVWLMNLYSRTRGLYYGSGVFVLRSAWDRAGGYDPALRWGEDVEFTERLKRIGPHRFLADTHAVYSERKFRQNGYFREFWRRTAQAARYARDRRFRRPWARLETGPR